jgi:hypothetical protein
MTAPGLISLLAFCCLSASGAQYYADSRAGDDNSPGTTRRKPWRSLKRVNATRFQPGDRVLFRVGSAWSGQLLITAQGAPGRPVTFQMEGHGPRPRIDACGRFEDAVILSNARHVVIRDNWLGDIGGDGIPPWATDRCLVEHNILQGANERADTYNAVYIAPAAEVRVLLVSDWSGWAKGLELRNNLFCSEGIGRYGHQVSRNADGSYGLAPGWGPATNVVFFGSHYEGRHEDRPAEGTGDDSLAPQPVTFEGWPGPQFDPLDPEKFGAFIKAHRAWMLRLMERQFGRRPPLNEPR